MTDEGVHYEQAVIENRDKPKRHQLDGLGTWWVQSILLIWLICCILTDHWNAAAGMGIALSITVKGGK